MRYVAVVHKDPNSCYGAHAPDVPGAIGTGETVAEALASLGEALALHLDLLAEEGMPSRPPSRLEDLMADSDLSQDFVGGLACLVEVRRNMSGFVRLGISLDRSVVERLDGVTRSAGITRSAAIEQAIALWLADQSAPFATSSQPAARHVAKPAAKAKTTVKVATARKPGRVPKAPTRRG